MINAEITDIFFGLEDDTKLCFTITFKDEDGIKTIDKFYGENGLEKLYLIMTIFKVTHFKELIGKPCRITRNAEGIINHIHHFIFDRGVDIR